MADALYGVGGGGIANIAAGANITLSTSGGSVTVIGGAGGAGFTAGVSSQGNTLGTTGTVANSLILVGGSNVTLSQSSGVGGATVTFVAGQSIQTQNSVLVNGSSGALSFNAGAMMSLSTAAGALTFINLASSATHIQEVSSATAAGAMVSRFANEDHVHAGVGPAGISSGGNTAGNTGALFGRLVFVGGSNITLSGASSNNNAQTISIIGAAGSGAGMKVGVSSIGNTSGETGTFSNQVVFAGGNNITLSGATNSDGVTYTISAPSGGGIGVSTDGNTAGTTGTVDYQYILVGGSNISLSQSTNGSSGTVTINGPTPPQPAESVNPVSSVNVVGTQTALFAIADHRHAGVFSIGMSTGGNTSGVTKVLPGQMVFQGGSNITLSQATDSTNGMTLEINGPLAAGTLSQWQPGGVGVSSAMQFGQSTLVMFPAAKHEAGSFSRMDLFGLVSVSTSSNSSYQGTLSFHAGIYTRNVSTLSLASSGSVSYTWNGTGATSLGSLEGLRNFSVPVNAVMTPGEYFIGILSQTASTNANWVTINNIGLVPFAASFGGQFGGATNASNQMLAGLGVFSAQTAAIPGTVAFGGLIATGAGTGRPFVNLMNYTA